MDSETLVIDQLEDGKKLVDRLRQAEFPISIAFWNRPDDDGRWSLCIASPVVDRDGALAGYRRFVDVRRTFGTDFSIGPSDVKLISDRHPVVSDLLDLQRTKPERLRWDERPLVVTGVVVESSFPQPYTVVTSQPLHTSGV